MLREEEKHRRMSLVMGIHRYAEHLMTETKVLSSCDFDFFHYYQNRSFLVMCTTALMNMFILRLILKEKKIPSPPLMVTTRSLRPFRAPNSKLLH